MKNKSIEELVNGFKWTFAKTMPKNPHYYIVKHELKDPKEYERLYWYIYDHPTIVYFWGKPYKTTTIGNYMYWIMTDDITESWIINRKEIKSEDI